MAKCINCSAPLPLHTTICEYCNSRNDVDLKGIHEYTITKPEADRICPACNIPMQTINIAGVGKYYIERCDRCMGLFFDPGEIEALMDESVSNVFSIDHKGLNRIIEDRSGQPLKVKYVKCPVCLTIMNRVNFGKRSGVVVDRCKGHGIWLDAGQLKQLMEWRKAGGRLLHDKRDEEAKAKKINGNKRNPIQSPYHAGGADLSSMDADEDLLTSITNVIFRLFE